MGVDVVKDIWRHNRRPFLPTEMEDARGVGLRPSMGRLVKMVDTSHPAFPAIADILTDMANAGVEIDEAIVTAAIKLGKERHRRELAMGGVVSAEDVPLRLWPEENDRASIVYYTRRGDLIKIGTTVNPADRFGALLPDEILAWEPGGNREEKLRHRQFRHLRCNGEYFRQAPDILRHCKAIRKIHGDPDPTWPTMGGRPLHARHLPLVVEMPAPASPELVTATEAASILGIKRGTVQAWAFRKLLKPVRVDDRKRPVYFLDHVRYLKSQSRAYRDTA